MRLDLRLPAPTVLTLADCVQTALSMDLPGSPSEPIRHCARGLRDGAALLRAALERLHGLGAAQSFWSGSAADEFSELVRQAPRHVGAVADRYDAYAGVLDRYAATVEVVRADVVRHRPALRMAWARFNAAVNAAVNAAGNAAGNGAGTAAGPSAGAEQTERAAATAACLAAYDEVRVDYDRWADAARLAARQLHRIDDHDPLQNPQGLHALANTVSGVCSQLAQICAVAGLICVLVCPVAAPIFFAASAGLSAVQVAVDIDRAVQFGEHVSAGQFAGAALGVLPVSGVAKAGVAGARAARSATGIGTRSVRAVEASLRSVARTGKETARSGLDGARELGELGAARALGQAFGAASLTALGRHWEDVATTGGQNVIQYASVPFGGTWSGRVHRPPPMPGVRVSLVVTDGPNPSRRVVITVPAGRVVNR